LSTAGGKTAVPARTQSDVSYREPLLLLHNDDRGNFQNMAQLAGPIFQQGFRARGLAVGDWDNDGRTSSSRASTIHSASGLATKRYHKIVKRR
jgi:hypothetical protein